MLILWNDYIWMVFDWIQLMHDKTGVASFCVDYIKQRSTRLAALKDLSQLVSSNANNYTV